MARKEYPQNVTDMSAHNNVQIGTLTTAYVEYEHHPIFQGGDKTPGQQLDEIIEVSRNEGRNILGFSIEFQKGTIFE